MLMCSEHPTRIRISDEIYSDLALRDTANMFFNIIETRKANHIIIDFSDVKSISRSFAQQYAKRKNVCKKYLEDVNIPDNVRKMFEAVENQEEKRSFLKRSSIKFVCL